MDEETGSPPEKLLTCPGLFFSQLLNHGVEVSFTFLDSRTFRGNVTIVKTVVVDFALLEKLEERFDPNTCIGNGVGSIVPRSISGPNSKWISEGITHCVPVGCGEPELITHGLSCDDLLGVVPSKDKFIPGLGTGKWYRVDSREELSHSVTIISYSPKAPKHLHLM
jgi:hypothetical protein